MGDYMKNYDYRYVGPVFPESKGGGMLTTVISGGQTGADIGGLMGAMAIGLKTGGYAPKGYRTENGPCPELAMFGVKEMLSMDYRLRTEKNIKESDCTVIFGNGSSLGSVLTSNLCKAHDRPCVEVYYPQIAPIENVAKSLLSWLYKEKDVHVLNVAGNRESGNPGITAYVFRAFLEMRRIDHLVLARPASS
jgi:hypothetical protein